MHAPYVHEMLTLSPCGLHQMLTYYELDLGLNHVVRRWSEPTDPRANLLVACMRCPPPHML